MTTSPSLTEIAFALGAGDRVVAVSDHCAYPPEVQGRARIGPLLAPSVERILALRPDLVVLHDFHDAAAGALAASGVRVLRLRLESAGDIDATIRALGGALGRAAAAQALIERIARDLESLPPPERPVPALIVVGRDPGALRGIYAAGPGSYLDDLLRRAGGVNVLADAGLRYPKIAADTIVARAPEVIVESVTAGVSEAQVRADWAALATVPAVRDGRVHLVPEALYSTPGPRIGQVLRGLRALLAR